MVRHLVKVFIVFILTRARTIIELRHSFRIIVVEHSRYARISVSVLGLPWHTRLATILNRRVTGLANYIKIGSIGRFTLMICPLFCRGLASPLVLVFSSRVLDQACAILMERYLGLSLRLEDEITFLDRCHMALPRTFGPWVTALRNLAWGSHALFLNFLRALTVFIIVVHLWEGSLRQRLPNCILARLITITGNLCLFRHIRLSKYSLRSERPFLGFAAHKFRITCNEITGKHIFVSPITAYGDAGLLVYLIIFVVRIFWVVRSASLVDVPHLDLVLFNLFIGLAVISYRRYSRILKGFANDFVWQVLNVGKTLTILCLIFPRNKAASHGIAIHLIGVMIQGILGQLLLCIQELILRQESIWASILNPGLLSLGLLFCRGATHAFSLNGHVGLIKVLLHVLIGRLVKTHSHSVVDFRAQDVDGVFA